MINPAQTKKLKNSVASFFSSIKLEGKLIDLGPKRKNASWKPETHSLNRIQRRLGKVADLVYTYPPLDEAATPIHSLMLTHEGNLVWVFRNGEIHLVTGNKCDGKSIGGPASRALRRALRERHIPRMSMNG